MRPRAAWPVAVVALHTLLGAVVGCGSATDLTLAAGTAGGSPPQADAGDDLTVRGGRTVKLDGSHSFDPDGDALTFAWSHTAGDIAVLLDGPTDRPALHFTAPEVTTDTWLEFTLTVGDGRQFTTDTVAVVVTESVGGASSPLIAASGHDRSVLESEVVVLDGRGSFSESPDSPLEYVWTQRTGPDVELSDFDEALISFIAPLVHGEPERLVFQLEVLNEAYIAVDTVTITVLPSDIGAAACGDPHPTVLFELDRSSGPAPLEITFNAVSSDGSPLPADGELTWVFDDLTESGTMKTHAQWKRIFRAPGIHTVGLCLVVGGASWGCLSTQEREMRRQLTVWPVLSGRVVQDERGLGGIVMSANNVGGGATAVTDGNGYFRIEVPYGWSGVITPDHFAYAFTPRRVVLSDVRTNVLHMTFDVAHDGPFQTADAEDGNEQAVALPLLDCVVDADCDDGMFCNGPEQCIAGVCLSGTAPCPAGGTCDEAAGQCVQCQTDADCQDGQFCNGVETCQAGACTSGPPPCSGDQACDEAADHCYSAAERVVGMTLINADTDAPIAGHDPLIEGAAIDLTVSPALNVRIDTDPPAVGSVRFELRRNGTLINMHTENNPPYALFGNNGGDYLPWPDGGPVAGSIYALKATPFPAAGAGGTPGAPLTLSFGFVQTGSCGNDSDCDDGLFCNGAETCSGDNCVSGSPACAPGETCDETDDACHPVAVACAVNADCDDGLYCNGAEICQQGQCLSEGTPCQSGQYCIESSDTCQVGTWSPPVGVPAPEFGIEEASAPYDSANPLHYYVDNTHAAATNSGNPRGSPTQPRETIPMDLPAGAVVEVHGGPYDYNSLAGKLYVSGNGTPSQPIFIRGAGPDARPLFTKDMFVKGSYIILEQLHFDNHGVELRPVMGSFDHVAVRRCEFAGNGQAGGGGTIKVVGNPTLVTDIVLWDNHIHDNGDDRLDAPDLGRHGILVSYNVERCWVVDNHIHDNGSDSIQVNFHGSVSPKVPARHVYIGRNTMHGDRENAVDIKLCNDVVISENVIYDYASSQTSSGEAMVIHKGQTTADYTRPENIWVLNNEIRDSRLGVVVTAGSEIFVMGNLVRDIRHTESGYEPSSIYAGGVGVHARNSGPVHVLHNTIHDCDSGLTANATLHSANNIFGHIAEVSSYHINVANGAAVMADRDVFHNDDGQPRIRWSGANYTFSGFQASSGQEAAGQQADPQFVSTSGGNFRLTAGSPAVDAGGPLHAAFNTFFNRYGIDIAFDRDGAARVQGAAADAGAYER